MGGGGGGGGAIIALCPRALNNRTTPLVDAPPIRIDPDLVWLSISRVSRLMRNASQQVQIPSPGPYLYSSGTLVPPPPPPQQFPAALDHTLPARRSRGGWGGLLPPPPPPPPPPPNIEVGGLSRPPLALPSGSDCERVFFEIAVLSVTVSLNRVSLASQTSLLTIDTMDWGPGEVVLLLVPRPLLTSITGLRDY